MQLSDLRIGRRGKHHKLITGILDHLEALPEGSALIIPREGIGEMSVTGLRSAVTRATTARQIPVATHSDDKSFYIWKKSPIETPRAGQQPKKKR
jgi:hypothetical protein